MAKHTLTDQLVTTRSFSPTAGARRTDVSRPASPPAGQSLEELVRQEEQELKRQSIAQSWAEVRRRRGEVLIDIDRAIHTLEKRRTEAEEMLRTLSHRREAVAAIDVEQPEEPSLDQLRRMKQDLHDAQVELTVFQRLDRDASTPHGMGLADLGFADLSRIGLGLFWPVVAGLVVAAVLLAVVLRLVLAA